MRKAWRDAPNLGVYAPVTVAPSRMQRFCEKTLQNAEFTLSDP